MSHHSADARRPVGDSGLHSVNRLATSSIRRESTIPLDGDWRFALLLDGQLGNETSWTTVQVPDLWTMREPADPPHYTNVPMPFDEVYPRIPARNPVGVYRREVDLDAIPADQRAILHVGAAEGYLEVAVNGVHVGSSSDSHLAAEFDITEALHPGSNLVELSVAKWSAVTYLEDQDQWWHSGISRAVHLALVPATRLTDVRIAADRDPATGAGRLDLTAWVDALRQLPENGYRVRVTAGGQQQETAVAPRLPAPTLPRPSRDRSVRPEQRFPEDFMELVSLDAAAADVPPEFRAIPETAVGPGAVTSLAGTAAITVDLPDVEPWSAEHPALTDVLVELVDADGTVTDAAQYRVGFRRVEVVGKDLLVNGGRILVQGVNRHDVDPRTGRILSRARMLAELSLLKQNNINAIRTSHYPNDPVLLDLCDDLGLYVIDEADVEGHAFASTIADEPAYAPEILTRVQRMVLRDRNHACIIAWSLGNETGYGAAHDAAAAWVRHTDPTRPTFYEGAIATDWYGGHAAADVVCPMYPSFASLEAYGRDPRADRPMILAEYAYSQGNSTGGFARYWELFESLPGLQGGFAWEFLDHALDPDGDGRYRYGGDFGDEPNSGPVLLNGLVFADLTPKPAMYEVRAVHSPVRVTSDATHARRGLLRLRNRRTFVDLADDLAFDVHVETTTGSGRSHTLTVPSVPAGSEGWVRLPDAVVTELHHPDALGLTLTVRTARATGWASAGTPLAEHQVELGHRPLPLPTGPGRPATEPARVLDHPLLALSPRLSLWRALTDNDSAYALDERFVRSGFFRLGVISEEAMATAQGAEIATRYQTAFGDEVRHRRQVTVLDEHDLVVTELVELPTGTRDGLRVGVEMHLVPGFETVSWVGLGPVENYPDRRSGALLGRWELPIDQTAVPYVRPQETGLRGEVTAMEFAGPAGRVEVTCDVPLHMSATRYSAEQLEAADHWWELPPSTATVVHIDVAHRGVGTGRIGPDTVPQHRLFGERYTWTWRLRVYAA